MNITTKYNIGDEVYCIASDNTLYMGEVLGISVNSENNLLYSVYSRMWRPAGLSNWESDEYYPLTMENIPESELFATEEELLSKGKEPILRNRLRNEKKRLKDLREMLSDNQLKQGSLDGVIREQKADVIRQEETIEKLKKELEEFRSSK